jgi:hypothetical protein
MPSWLNPFSSVEMFDSWAKTLTGIFATCGVVFTALSWKRGLTEVQKKRLTFWERLCFLIGAVLFWVTLKSDNLLSNAEEQRFSKATNEVDVLKTNLAQLEAKMRPKPLAERIRAVLDKIDPGILRQIADDKLKNSQVGIAELDLPESTAVTLRDLCAEEGASEYLRFETSGRVKIRTPLNPPGTTMGGTVVDMKLFISPKLIQNQENGAENAN